MLLDTTPVTVWFTGLLLEAGAFGRFGLEDLGGHSVTVDSPNMSTVDDLCSGWGPTEPGADKKSGPGFRWNPDPDWSGQAIAARTICPPASKVVERQIPPG
ncbi:MAG: hypothetical protein QOH82_160 [Mycobacterium sp.]|nr:hypothetical protein [Mycobacterium sp.]